MTEILHDIQIRSVLAHLAHLRVLYPAQGRANRLPSHQVAPSLHSGRLAVLADALSISEPVVCHHFTIPNLSPSQSILIGDFGSYQINPHHDASIHLDQMEHLRRDNLA